VESKKRNHRSVEIFNVFRLDFVLALSIGFFAFSKFCRGSLGF
jgi:hypothetical protein